MEIVDFECVVVGLFFLVGRGGRAAKNKTNKKKDDIRCVLDCIYGVHIGAKRSEAEGFIQLMQYHYS